MVNEGVRCQGHDIAHAALCMDGRVSWKRVCTTEQCLCSMVSLTAYCAPVVVQLGTLLSGLTFPEFTQTGVVMYLKY